MYLLNIYVLPMYLIMPICMINNFKPMTLQKCNFKKIDLSFIKLLLIFRMYKRKKEVNVLEL